MSRDTYIPQYLDEPERFFVFTPDELIAVVTPLAISTVVANFAVGLAVATGAFVLLRKLKQGGGLHRLLWILYWHLPADVLRLKGSPPSHLRELAG
jgi:conjugal transfer pilus assembly protein TraL